MTTAPVSNQFKPVPLFFADEKTHRRKLAEKINDLNNAKFNCAVEFTLTANAGTTLLQDPRITGSSVFLFMPTTANAAAVQNSIYVPEATILPTVNQTPGQATINHANDANADKIFRVAILG